MKININKLNSHGFPFQKTDIADIIYYLQHQLEYLYTHNKNYTKKQYNIIEDVKNILDCIEFN